MRRFVQLMGIYPVGTLVRLNSNEVGVVLRVHAPDPFRPKVRVLFDADGARMEIPRDINLWEAEAGAQSASSVIAPLNPADYKIDPLTFV